MKSPIGRKNISPALLILSEKCGQILGEPLDLFDSTFHQKMQVIVHDGHVQQIQAEPGQSDGNQIVPPLEFLIVCKHQEVHTGGCQHAEIVSLRECLEAIVFTIIVIDLGHILSFLQRKEGLFVYQKSTRIKIKKAITTPWKASCCQFQSIFFTNFFCDSPLRTLFLQETKHR